MVEIENLPDWLTENDWPEDTLEEMLEDPFLDEEDRDSIQTVLYEM